VFGSFEFLGKKKDEKLKIDDDDDDLLDLGVSIY